MRLFEAVNRAKLFPDNVANQIDALNGNEKNEAIYKYLEQYVSSEPGSPYDGQVGDVIDVTKFIDDLVAVVLLWGTDGSNVHQNPIVHFLEHSEIPKNKIETVGQTAIELLGDALEEGDLPNDDFDRYFVQSDTGIFDETGNAFKYKLDILKIFLDQNQLKKYATDKGSIPDINWIFGNEPIDAAEYPKVSRTAGKFLNYSDMKKVAKALVQDDSSKEKLSLKKVMQDQFKLTKPDDINTKIKEFFNDSDIKKELRVVPDADKYQKYTESYLIGDKKDKAQDFLKLVEIEYPYDAVKVLQGIENKATGVDDDSDEPVLIKDIIKKRGWTPDTSISSFDQIIKDADASLLKPKAKSTLRSFIKGRLEDASGRKDLLNWKIASNTDSDIVKGFINYRAAFLKNNVSGKDILANVLGITKKSINNKHLQDQAIRVCKVLKLPNESDIIKKIKSGSLDANLDKIFRKKYAVTPSIEKPLKLITPELEKLIKSL